MPSARAAGTPSNVINTSMLLKSASVAGDHPPRFGAVVAQFTAPTKVMTTSMPLKSASVAGDYPHFGGG
jgi:hypothetical protein